MRKTLSVCRAFLLLLFVFSSVLNAGTVRKVYRQEPVTGDEPWLQALHGDWNGDFIPSPPRVLQVGTVVDSTIMDHQANATISQRISAIGDSALHVTAMVSPDEAFTERGMKYIYYNAGEFSKIGYVEGNGLGTQRGGYGSVFGYNWPERGIGDVAILSTHTNLANRSFPSGGTHWYLFQDLFEGLGAYGAYEGPWGDGVDICDAFLWPTFYISNDAVGHIAMIGITFDASCTGGFDDIKATYKTFDDVEWSEPVLLDELDDPTQWGPGGPDIPMMAGSDAGICGAVASSFTTNIYYWESTDFGQTWGARQSITGYPLEPITAPPDTTSPHYRPMQNNAIGMSRNGTPHVIWTEYQAQGDADSIFTPGGGVFQYRTKLQHWDPIHGVNTVYRHPDGLANFAGGTAFAYNVGHPAVGFGPSDDIVYAVYEGFVDSDQDPSNQLYFGDIYVSVSLDGGATWKDRVNITNSIGSDDLYPSIARLNPQGIVLELPGFSVGNADGMNDFVLIYQNDDVAGTFMRAEETEPNWDMLLVAPVDFDTIPATGIEDDTPEAGGLPKAFALAQNYPNPFNPQTTIRYTLAADAHVRLSIHNLRGEAVTTLVSRDEKAGEYSVAWDGRNASGERVASGIYFYRLSLGDGKTMTKKMVVLK
jgi:hypothetical protein